MKSLAAGLAAAVGTMVAVGSLLPVDVAYADCPAGEHLLWEDASFWHCGIIAPPWEVDQALERAELLGPEFRYRKALLDGLRSLRGVAYRMGSKWDITVGGKRIRFCSSGPCDHEGATIDCSGAAAYAQLSACLVSGICQETFPQLRAGLLGESSNAAGIASFFYRHGAFNTQAPRRRVTWSSSTTAAEAGAA